MSQNHFSKFQLDLTSEYGYFPLEIANWCIENYNYFYVIHLNDLCTLRVATKTKRIPNVHNYTNIIKCMIHAFSIPFKKNLVISLYPTHFIKKWDKKQRLTNIHVNSGFTTFKENVTEIIIYRKEEIHKVLFHELIHALELHCVYASTFYNVKNMHHADESIVETWATILHGLYAKHQNSSNITHLNIKSLKYSDLDVYFKTVEFQKEQQFILTQSAHLLKSHKCTFLDSRCIKKFPKVPAVFFYYICKAAFMMQPEKFIRQFWWTNIKKCKNIPISYANEYLINPSFLHAIYTIPTNALSMSMKMTITSLA